MKQLIWPAMFALSFFALVSCGSEEEKKKNDPQPNQQPITGQWNLINLKQFSKDASGNDVTPPHDASLPKGDFTVNFAADGSYEEKTPSGNRTGTYTYADKKINIALQPDRLMNGTKLIDSLSTIRLVLRDTLKNQGVNNIRVYTLVR